MYIMYNVTLKPNLIIITFGKLTNRTELFKSLFFYLKNNDTIITKILIVSYKNNIPWYNDVTHYKNISFIKILLETQDEIFRDKTESTHILDSSVLDTNICIYIHTLNNTNPTPKAISNKAFKLLLFKEFMSGFKD
jgi:hypothetical protein